MAGHVQQQLLTSRNCKLLDRHLPISDNITTGTIRLILLHPNLISLLQRAQQSIVHVQQVWLMNSVSLTLRWESFKVNKNAITEYGKRDFLFVVWSNYVSVLCCYWPAYRSASPKSGYLFANVAKSVTGHICSHIFIPLRSGCWRLKSNELRVVNVAHIISCKVFQTIS